MRDRLPDIEERIRRKLVAGLTQAAYAHSAEYRKRVTEITGDRPLPDGPGPYGPPWRSRPDRDYPYIDPDTDKRGDRVHGYTQIGVEIHAGDLLARSGVTEEGLHLALLSEPNKFTMAYGERLGMDDAYVDIIEEIALAFKLGAMRQQ